MAGDGEPLLMRRCRVPAALTLLTATLAVAGAPARASAPAETTFGRPVLLAGMPSGWTEPRVVTAPDGVMWAATNDPSSGHLVVMYSADGRRWHRTVTDPPGQQEPTTDVDLVVTASGRVIVTELDGAAVRFVTDYTDDAGRVWSTSRGTSYADTDRPWLAVGPVDPATRQSRVYLLFHNLLTGSALHEMFVATSRDGGASFGPPVPIATPGSAPFLDLQCADSGAPSALVVDRQTGRIYAVFGTRSSAAGGCGASATGTFEVNVVGETRIWVASSPDGTLGSWTDHLAYDGAPDTVSASFETASIDSAGSVYVAFAQTAHTYPDFSRAAVRYVATRDGAEHWSRPVTVTGGSPVGTYDPTVAAGGAGQLLIAYDEGQPANNGVPTWTMRFARVTNALGPRPHVVHGLIDRRPAYAETADEMGGSCATGPLAGAENGLLCDRASDDFGITLTRDCRVLVVYPTTRNSAAGSEGGTWAATQRSGASLCGRAARNRN